MLGCSVIVVRSFLQMAFAISQDGVGFLLIDQIKGKVGGNVTKRERHQGPLLQAVVDAVRVGIRNLVREGNLDDPIRLSSFQLSAPKLQAHQGCQMEQIGVRDLGADQRGKKLGFPGVGNCQLDLFEPLSRRAGQRSFHPRLRLGTADHRFHSDRILGTCPLGFLPPMRIAALMPP